MYAVCNHIDATKNVKLIRDAIMDARKWSIIVKTPDTNARILTNAKRSANTVKKFAV